LLCDLSSQLARLTIEIEDLKDADSPLALIKNNNGELV
jgi:hypothetical protein